METIAVSQLRQNLMKVLKEIEKGSSVFITSHGRIVAQITPPQDDIVIAKETLLALGENADIGDIVSPIEASWEANT